MATKITKIDRLYVQDEPDDSLDHLDLSKAVPVKFPNLKLSTETISLRMPLTLLDTIKIEANKQDVPYQSLIKMVLMERFGRPVDVSKKKRLTAKKRRIPKKARVTLR